jgi:hypothetical protein
MATSLGVSLQESRDCGGKSRKVIVRQLSADKNVSAEQRGLYQATATEDIAGCEGLNVKN